jgi:hypothetical protein
MTMVMISELNLWTVSLLWIRKNTIIIKQGYMERISCIPARPRFVVKGQVQTAQHHRRSVRKRSMEEEEGKYYLSFIIPLCFNKTD